MPEHSDGYALNAHIQSRSPIPTPRIIDALVSLEADMRMAQAGRRIPLEQWMQWARKEKPNTDALIRVLFLVVAIADMSADDIAKLRRDMKNAAASRRRPPRPIRESGPRISPQLW